MPMRCVGDLPTRAGRGGRGAHQSDHRTRAWSSPANGPGYPMSPSGTLGIGGRRSGTCHMWPIFALVQSLDPTLSAAERLPFTERVVHYDLFSFLSWVNRLTWNTSGTSSAFSTQ
jgi:hypothetical protein